MKKAILFITFLFYALTSIAQINQLNDTVKYGTSTTGITPQYSFGIWHGFRLPYITNPTTGKTDLLPTAKYIRNFYGAATGISSGLLVTTPTVTSAVVTPGVWVIEGVEYSTTSNTNFTLEAANATQSRYDIIYATSAGLNIAHGTLSLTPVDPTLPANSIQVSEISITPTSTRTSVTSKSAYVTTNTAQSVTGAKTFTQPLTIPDGTSPNHAVSLEQLNTYNFTNVISNSFHSPTLVNSGFGLFSGTYPFFTGDFWGISRNGTIIGIDANDGTGTGTGLGGTFLWNNSVANTYIGSASNYFTFGYNGVVTRSYDGANVLWSSDLNNTPSFAYGLNTNGAITLTSTGGGSSTISGNTWDGQTNGSNSSIKLIYGIYLRPGYEGIYANDYTSGTELFHFGKPGIAEEGSRIDENFALNYTLPQYVNPLANAQVVVKDNTTGFQGYLAGINVYNLAYQNVTLITASYTVLASDQFIEAATTSGSVTATIPNATSNKGKVYTFKLISGTNSLVLTTGGGNIDGVATYTINSAMKYVTILSDGTNYYIISNN